MRDDSTGQWEGPGAGSGAIRAAWPGGREAGS